jgi:diacylglycerol O-acyltransferase
MADYRYERLTALDNFFLVFESPDTPLHVASTAIFEAGPLTMPNGGIDIERITAHIMSRLHLIPRYRERLTYIPIEAHPVWVDDERFNLNYHLRHTSLPKPGDVRQLKRLSARIMSQQLDRGKPLWETWIVEGLEGSRFAMISKTHHCMIDGISGVDLLTVLLSSKPDDAVTEPVRWIPRPAPSRMELLRDEVMQRMRAPLGAVSRLLREPGAVLDDVREGLAAVGETIGQGMRMASKTPLNQPIGPHRRFDWTAVDIAAIKAIREHLGGSLNDVVLATVCGGVRRFLERRSIGIRGLDFRVFVPVSLRASEEHGTLGNRVAGWMVDLPIAERDPRKRLAKIRETTARLKESRQARGSEILTEVAEWTGTTVLSLGMRLASRANPFNLVVTNVPGPANPLYLLGARMLEAYPMVPLFTNLGLGVALFSNAGKLFWGFNADWDAVPDLHDFVGAIEGAFAEMRETASVAPPLHAPRAQRAAHRGRPNGSAEAHT